MSDRVMSEWANRMSMKLDLLQRNFEHSKVLQAPDQMVLDAVRLNLGNMSNDKTVFEWVQKNWKVLSSDLRKNIKKVIIKHNDIFIDCEMVQPITTVNWSELLELE